MRNVKSLILVGFIFSLSSLVYANPVQDGFYQGKKLGWFPSSSTPCSVVCRRARGSVAEFEKFNMPSLVNKYTYVCKAKETSNMPLAKGELYGNNFSSAARRKVCMVSTSSGHVHRKLNFMCLCVISR
ncbi:MAG: hypothetical protein HOE90_22690 [Bacteriovoracaceae bacterium]|nr:hypothetical protein [Bacteriovoracaceae bacterium]